MIELDAATVLLQWAAGGLLFLWVTTRRRQVGVGYGWLLRGTYAVLAFGAAGVGAMVDAVAVREVSAAATALAASAALVVSIARRRAGVAGERERLQRVRERVAVGYETTGIERGRRADPDPAVPEYPPALDLVAPVLALPGLVAAALAAAEGAGAGSAALAIARTLAGALFLGAVTDAMLLGHWYLVQPGLARAPLLELVRWVGLVWPVEVGLLLLPTGMVSVWAGTIDDGYGGMLGWFWAACAVTTIVLVGVTRAALRERAYSAVMAATGLLYLAILTAFGTDLVARAVLAG